MLQSHYLPVAGLSVCVCAQSDLFLPTVTDKAVCCGRELFADWPEVDTGWTPLTTQPQRVRTEAARHIAAKRLNISRFVCVRVSQGGVGLDPDAVGSQ